MPHLVTAAGCCMGMTGLEVMISTTEAAIIVAAAATMEP